MSLVSMEFGLFCSHCNHEISKGQTWYRVVMREKSYPVCGDCQHEFTRIHIGPITVIPCHPVKKLIPSPETLAEIETKLLTIQGRLRKMRREGEQSIAEVTAILGQLKSLGN